MTSTDVQWTAAESNSSAADAIVTKLNQTTSPTSPDFLDPGADGTNRDVSVREMDDANTNLQEVLGVQGQPLTLICEAANSSTSPRIKWHRQRDGGIEEVIEGASGATITIDMVTAEDEGEYKCTVSHSRRRGEQITVFRLQIDTAGTVH